MDLQPKCKWATSYKYQPTWKDMLWDMGTRGLWNQRRGKKKLPVLSFSFFFGNFHSAFPILPNQVFKAAWACLYLISEVWADGSQSMFSDRILPPGNVDTDFRDMPCQASRPPIVKGPAVKDFELCLHMGLCFKTC